MLNYPNRNKRNERLGDDQLCYRKLHLCIGICTMDINEPLVAAKVIAAGLGAHRGALDLLAFAAA